MIALEAPKPDVNWSMVIPIVISASSSLLVIGALWDRIRKAFAAKLEFEYLKTEVHELRNLLQDTIQELNSAKSELNEHRVRLATMEKQDGKLDQCLELLKKPRRHE